MNSKKFKGAILQAALALPSIFQCLEAKECDISCSCFDSNFIIENRSCQNFTVQFFGELLYQQFFASSLDYLATGIGGTAAKPVNGTGKVYNFHADYQPGFKIGSTLFLAENNLLDITAQYTCFQTKGGSSFSSAKDTLIAVPFLFAGLGAGSITVHAASLAAKFDLNTIDLIGGYTFPVSSHLNLHPFGGLSGIINTLKVNVEYDYFTPIAPSGEEREILNSKMDAWGIGPIFGIDSNWNFTNCFSLLGSFAFRLPWIWQSETATQQQIRLTSKVPPSSFDILKSKYSDGTLAFVWDFLLGPQVDFWFKRKKIHSVLRVAWEWQIMSGDYWVYLNSSGDNSNVQAEMQGLNAAASIEF